MDQISDILSSHAEKLFDDIAKPAHTAKDQEQSQPTIDTEELKKIAYSIKDQVDALIRLLNGTVATVRNTINQTGVQTLDSGDKIIEGVFNGEKMIGPDGEQYAVPPNYASKSKLVEGDMMKLTITRSGSFIYKQIGPTPRKRIIGLISFDQDGQKWFVEVNGKRYKVLTASITFYKGKPGDDAVILVPEDGQSDWGAVENIISK